MSEDFAARGRAAENRLRAELLATASTAGTEHLLAAGGRLAREEAVTTGTHEIAGLERTLHIILEKLPAGERKGFRHATAKVASTT